MRCAAVRGLGSIATGDPERLRGSALGLLARREHSRAELRRKLMARGFESDDVDTELERLQAEGLASDVRFAEHYVRVRTGRGYGPVRIRFELRERGVEEEIIGCALEAPEGGWQRHAERVRRGRFGAQPPGDSTDRARQARFLQFRGFTAEQIGRALRAVGD